MIMRYSTLQLLQYTAATVWGSSNDKTDNKDYLLLNGATMTRRWNFKAEVSLDYIRISSAQRLIALHRRGTAALMSFLLRAVITSWGSVETRQILMW